MADGSRRGMTRRDFVRYAVAGSAVAGFGVLGVQSSRDSRAARSRISYVGVELLGGPAYNGLPLVPVRVGQDGVLEAKPKPGHLAAYRYCGMQGAPGLQDDYAGDDVLRYYANPEYLRVAESQGIDVWYGDRIGEPARASDFEELLTGASVSWRSEGQAGTNRIQLIVIRVHESTYPGSVQRTFAPDGFVAMTAACTHLCCTAGYRRSADAKARGQWDRVFCDCHGAYWDPLVARRYWMAASGVPSEAPRQTGHPILE